MLGKLGRLIGSGLAAGVALLGCYDGSIEIAFDVPSGPPTITSYRLVVYAEATGPLSCEALSFDDIPTDVLETTRVFAGETLPGEPLAVSGVPREGKKLFFAEAVVRTGVSIYAGCTEVGEITGPTLIDIEPVKRTNSAFDSALVVRAGDGGGLISPVGVTVVRLDGVLLENEPIRWRLKGAMLTGLFESSGDELTAAGTGKAIIEFDGDERPPFAGPVVLEVRTRWAQSQPAPLAAFLDPPPKLGAVSEAPTLVGSGRGSDVLEVGRLGSDTLPSIVVLASEAIAAGGRGVTTAHVFRMNGLDLVKDTARTVELGETADNSAARTLGKVRGPAGDEIIAVWKDPTGGFTWTELSSGEATPSPYSDIPIKLSAAGGCDGGQEEVLVAQLQSDREAIEFTNAELHAGATSIDNLRSCDLGVAADLVEIGCVRDTTNLYRNVFVFDKNIGGTASVLSTFQPAIGVGSPIKQEFTCGELPVLATTVWIGEFSMNDEGTMIVGEQTGEGPTTSRYLLQPINGKMTADFQSADPAPSIVIATTEGDINGDGETDIISLVSSGRGDVGFKVAVHVSMAIPGSSLRLRGTMSEDIDAITPRLRVEDVNGDKIDDIIVGSADVLRVYLMGPY